jgi:hypothetical protein
MMIEEHGGGSRARKGCKNTLLHGANEVQYDVAGMTVEQVRAVLGPVLNAPNDVEVLVNASPVEGCYRIRPGDVIDFIAAAGTKGLGALLTPEDLMARWGISVALYQGLRQMGLPTVQIPGGDTLHHEFEVDEWFRSGAHRASKGHTDTATPRLRIDMGGDAVILDGAPLGLKNHSQALILKVLLDAGGNWVSSTEMVRACPTLNGERVDRHVKALPAALRALVKRERGKGFRLIFPPPG